MEQFRVSQDVPIGKAQVSLAQLNERSREIFRQIVESYLATGEPVGSRNISRLITMPLSPASVRNVMSDLEQLGLIYAPHTSAGRVPTDEGYRLYVEAMADTVALPQVEQLMIRHQFGQVEYASEHWFRLAATTIASVTRAAGLATPERRAAVLQAFADALARNLQGRIVRTTAVGWRGEPGPDLGWEVEVVAAGDDQGGGERRRQRLDSRRLVGRGLDRRQRLGHRRTRDEP